MFSVRVPLQAERKPLLILLAESLHILYDSFITQRHAVFLSFIFGFYIHFVRECVDELVVWSDGFDDG